MLSRAGTGYRVRHGSLSFSTSTTAPTLRGAPIPKDAEHSVSLPGLAASATITTCPKNLRVRSRNAAISDSAQPVSSACWKRSFAVVIPVRTRPSTPPPPPSPTRPFASVSDVQFANGIIAVPFPRAGTGVRLPSLPFPFFALCIRRVPNRSDDAAN